MCRNNKNLAPILIGLNSAVFLIFIYNYQLISSAPFDYDAVKNYQTIQELARGNFHNFFHHASPVLYVFFLPFYLIYPNFWFLLSINALLGVFASLLWVRLLLKDAIKKPYNAITYLLLGTAFFAVSYSRTLSIETLGLFFSALLWGQIQSFLDQRKTFWASAWLIGVVASLLLLTNYKAIVPLTFMALLITFNRKGYAISFSWEFFKKILIGFCGIIALFMLVGIIAGLPWYKYPATIIGIVANAQETTAHPFNGRFYFQYLAEFENIALMLLGIWQMRNILRFPSNYTILWRLIAWTALLTYLVMLLLPKAPRGLIFVFPLLYLLGIKQLQFFFLEKWKKPSFYLVAAIVLIFWQIKIIWEKVYPYSQTSYPQVASILKKEQAEVVFTTLGIGIYPFLDSNIKLEILREASDTLKFQSYTGKKFLLYDSYGEISLHYSLISLKKCKYDYYFEEKSLCNPFLSLELVEYNRTSFRKAFEISEGLQKRKWQLALKKLP